MANQSVVFLERIQDFKEPLPVADVELMGKVYGYDKSENVELVSRYFGIGLKAKARSIYEPTAKLLGKFHSLGHVMSSVINVLARSRWKDEVRAATVQIVEWVW